MTSINPVATRITKGRHIGARQIVLSSLSSLDCAVFAKVIDEVNTANQTNRDAFIYGDEVEKLSGGDEHAFEYQAKGIAKLLLDRYAGGSIHKDWGSADGADNIFYGQIEPYELGKAFKDSVLNPPDWQIASHDVLAITLRGDVVMYFEVVGTEAQSLEAEYGVKYRLNKRDDFAYLLGN